MTKQPESKILIIGTNMMNLYHHRLELIKALLERDYKVAVAAPRSGEEKKLEKLGCRFINMPVDNRGTNIGKDLGLLRHLRKIYRNERPDVILTYYTKTNIYGGMVAGWEGIPYIENICGLGTTLVGDGAFSKVMGYLYRQALKKASFVFFQNKSNIKFIGERNIYRGPHTLLPGSGVSLERYQPLPYPETENIEFLFCSRVLKEKGIDEYLKAAKEIKKKYPKTQFHVAGPCEPSYIGEIEKHFKEGLIHYHGKVMELQPLLERIHCTVLPSYYPEGMANILLESAASARPIITTGLPGCGETVEEGVTGFVVKEKDARSLAAAMEKFILLPHEEKEKMGIAGRKKMEREFDRQIVTDKYLEKIGELISQKKNL
ncbi:MAG: glycosyltransferase family 4 protein [Muribaculaceae bacterium]|nr:glycosyltransferase family 4 protein [Muribaculaceae bacterium]